MILGAMGCFATHAGHVAVSVRVDRPMYSHSIYACMHGKCMQGLKVDVLHLDQDHCYPGQGACRAAGGRQVNAVKKAPQSLMKWHAAVFNQVTRL